jgi:hypothetical protein
VTGRRGGAVAPAGAREGGGPAPRRRRLRVAPIVGIVLVLAAAIGLTVKLVGGGAANCQSSFIPAFFTPQTWTRAVSGSRVPSVMILNPASGPGTAPDPAFRAAVRRARSAGTRVIGYIGTNYAGAPLAQAQQYVRDYRVWYGVTGIFLDQTPTSGDQQIGYYQQLARYIHRTSPAATIWLNPGVYPDQRYMSIGDVVMVFEGPFAHYQSLPVPNWAHRYPAARFGHTIYATPGADVARAVSLSRSRNAGYVYITDASGSNPYRGLPSYWPREEAAVAGGCSP